MDHRPSNQPQAVAPCTGDVATVDTADACNQNDGTTADSTMGRNAEKPLRDALGISHGRPYLIRRLTIVNSPGTSNTTTWPFLNIQS